MMISKQQIVLKFYIECSFCTSMSQAHAFPLIGEFSVWFWVSSGTYFWVSAHKGCVNTRFGSCRYFYIYVVLSACGFFGGVRMYAYRCRFLSTEWGNQMIAKIGSFSFAKWDDM